MTEQVYIKEYNKIIKDIEIANEKGEDLKVLRAKLKALKLYYDTKILNRKEMEKLS